jgi:hypothetical protein
MAYASEDTSVRDGMSALDVEDWKREGVGVLMVDVLACPPWLDVMNTGDISVWAVEVADPTGTSNGLNSGELDVVGLG